MLSQSIVGTLEREYRKMAALAADAAPELVSTLSAHLKEDHIDTAFPLVWRVKSWDSVLSKCERSNVAHVTHINDLIGIRITVQFRSDIHRIRHSLQRRFHVPTRREDRFASPDAFGYTAVHLVVPGPLHPELGHVMAEIQVRTTAQHIWASASHRFQYKRENAIAPRHRRALHRLAAVLELVDDELERLREVEADVATQLPVATRRRPLVTFFRQLARRLTKAR